MAKEWDSRKAEIETLYITQGQTLEEVRRIMKGRYGFEASIRSYRMKLEEWHLKKNNTPQNGTEPTLRIKAGRKRTRKHPITRLAQNNLATTTNVPHEQVLWREEYAQVSKTSASQLNHNSGFGLAPIAATTAYRIAATLDVFNAIWTTDLDALEKLLYSGSTLEILDAQHQTPLMAAIPIGNESIVNCLLRYGADVDKGGLGFSEVSPIHQAITMNKWSVTRLLVKYSANLALRNSQGNTPLNSLLNKSCWWEDLEIISLIRILLSAGSSINSVNKWGQSPLHAVVSQSETHAVNVLKQFLHHSPDVGLQMRDGKSVFELFLDRSHEVLTAGSRNVYWGLYDTRWETVHSCLCKFIELGASAETTIQGVPFLNYYLEEVNFISLWSKSRNKRIFERWAGLLNTILSRSSIHYRGTRGNTLLHSLFLRPKPGFLVEFPDALDFKLFLNRNVDLNQRNDAGKSILQVCIERLGERGAQVVEDLIQAGASVMDVFIQGRTLFEPGSCTRPIGVGLMKTLLRGDLKQRHALSDEAKWISIWRSACESETLSDAMYYLEQLWKVLSRPLSKVFDGCSFLVLAEYHLDIHKEQLELWKNGKLDREKALHHRQAYKETTTKCRDWIRPKNSAKGVPEDVDISYYKFLLEILDI